MIKDNMTREEFLASFGNLANAFEGSLKQAEDLNSEFENSLKNFSTSMASIIDRSKQNLVKNKNHPLSDQLDGFFQAVSKTNHTWEKVLDSREKGINFCEKFSDSLLVFVYGKVKSGKSSLGNYIAWGKAVDYQQEQLQAKLQPQYFSHDHREVEGGDKKGEAEANRSFRVGATEATSSIQGFKLPGLTWVDSPGLHSYNDENGRLAKDYVDHADLIIYTMSSGSPGRESDLKEIDQLFDQDKKLVILITGSDKAEEDYDEENDQIISILKMKSSEDRKLQREYVRDALTILKNHNSPEILSVSAKYAELHPDDHSAMKDSGFSELFEILVKISQEEGVQLKRKTPLNNFKHFTELCQTDLKPYQKLIHDFRSDMTNTDQELERSTILHMSAVKRELEDKIRTDFETLSGYGDNPTMVQSDMREMRKSWDQYVNELAIRMVENVFADVMSEFHSNVRSSWNSSTVDFPDFNVEKITEIIPTYSKGTKKRNTGIGGLLGAAAGAFFGPVGIAIGSTLGSAAGGFMGNKATINSKEIELVIGNNLLDIEKQVIFIYSEGLKTFISQETGNIRKNFIGEANDFLNSVENELSKIEHKFNRILNETNKLLN